MNGELRLASRIMKMASWEDPPKLAADSRDCRSTSSPKGRYETTNITTTRMLMRAALDSSRYLNSELALLKRCRKELM